MLPVIAIVIILDMTSQCIIILLPRHGMHRFEYEYEHHITLHIMIRYFRKRAERNGPAPLPDHHQCDPGVLHIYSEHSTMSINKEEEALQQKLEMLEKLVVIVVSRVRNGPSNNQDRRSI